MSALHFPDLEVEQVRSQQRRKRDPDVRRGPVSPEPAAHGLASPEGMAVDRDGSLLVVEAGKGRLSRIDPRTGRRTTVAAGLKLGPVGSSGAPPTWALSSVAVRHDGTLFVTGDIADMIYRLHPRSVS